MTTQQCLFPLNEAYHELKDYDVMVDEALSCRITRPTTDQMWIHIEPQEDTSLDYLFERADCFCDDVREWFSQCYPMLDVRLIERANDWYVLVVAEK